MTETEWSACTHPQPMLEFLRGKATEPASRFFETSRSLQPARQVNSVVRRKRQCRYLQVS
jgi:hypothetical protein